MYETFYDKLQPYFGQENIQSHHIDTDKFVLSLNTKDIIKDLKIWKDVFNFSYLDENHEIFSNNNRRLLGKFKTETPKNNWIDEFFGLRSKMYAFECGDDSEIKLKVVSKNQ